MSVVLVEGEFLPVDHTVYEVGILRFRIRHFGYEFHDIRNCTFEAFIHLASRTLDIWNLALALEAFPLEYYLAAVLIGIGDAAPDADCVRMLLRSVHLYLHRECPVLAEDVLDRVDVVLAHIAQTASVIVPVSAECLMDTVVIVRLVRSRPQPHVIVEA